VRAAKVAVVVLAAGLVGALSGVLSYQWIALHKGAQVACYHVVVCNLKPGLKPGEVRRALLRAPYVVRVGGVRTAPSAVEACVIVRLPRPMSKWELGQLLSQSLRREGLGKAPAVFLDRVNAYIVEVKVRNPAVDPRVVARRLERAPAILAVFRAERRGSIYAFEVASLDDEYPVAYAVTGVLQAENLKPISMANVTPVKWGYVL